MEWNMGNKQILRILRLIQFKCSLDNKTVNNKFMFTSKFTRIN